MRAAWYDRAGPPSVINVTDDNPMPVCAANEVLVHAVRDVFRNMQLSYEGQGVRILPQHAEIPTSLRPEAVTERTFPMFVSAQDWLLLLDGTVCCDNLDDLRASCDVNTLL